MASDRRKALSEILHQIMVNGHVYFQPPESKKIQYPCIIYSISNGNSQYADDQSYIFRKRYMLMLIDTNPDSVYIDEIMKLPLCSFDRGYTADNLNHYVFNLFW